MKKILIINGPNLNLLGKREPHIYGEETMEDVLCRLKEKYPEVQIDYVQSNYEGEIIDSLHKAAYNENTPNGIILNAGGYTHTSVAIADAVAAIPTPVIEVHISNIYSREDFRRCSYLSPVCYGTISGFGTDVYRLALSALLDT